MRLVKLIVLMCLCIGVTVLAEAEQIDNGSSVSGTLARFQEHEHSFYARQGERLYLHADSDMQTYMYIYNPDGTLLEGAFNSFNQSSLSQTGTYRVRIKSRYRGEQGQYELHFLRDQTTSATVLAGNS